MRCDAAARLLAPPRGHHVQAGQEININERDDFWARWYGMTDKYLLLLGVGSKSKLPNRLIILSITVHFE